MEKESKLREILSSVYVGQKENNDRAVELLLGVVDDKDLGFTTRARVVAIKEVNKRIVTKDEAKASFISWINESASYPYFSDDILEFWEEVKRQVSNV